MSAGTDNKPNIETTLHATCVAFGAQGVLITGASGSGKSALALQLIALGATLVADDYTRVNLQDGQPIAHAPDRLAGVIEARHVGLLRVPFQSSTPVRLQVQMDVEETKRLPHNHVTPLLGIEIATIFKVNGPHFAASVKLLAIGGRHA